MMNDQPGNMREIPNNKTLNETNDCEMELHRGLEKGDTAAIPPQYRRPVCVQHCSGSPSPMPWPK